MAYEDDVLISGWDYPSDCVNRKRLSLITALWNWKRGGHPVGFVYQKDTFRQMYRHQFR